MIARILLAVDDSPAGLSAARTAMNLATVCEADVRAVTVLRDGPLESALAQISPGRESAAALRARRGGGQTALLRHVVDIGRAAGLVCETAALLGEPAPAILDEMRAYEPDVIVIGRSDRRSAGQPYVGSEVRHVLEFAEVPVLVVPPPSTLG
jgi:nucleotide-binding universal stress UspA family protein